MQPLLGKDASDLTGLSSPTFCYDEGLPPEIGKVLAHVGYPVVMARKGVPDEILIPWMGERHLTWITKDDRSKTQHEGIILEAGISIVFVRGLSHSKSKRSSLRRNTISLKDILLMLVVKLDTIVNELTDTSHPRFFILYMTASKKPNLEKHSTLREVQARLSGKRVVS
jgi:hypothetical protein